MMKFYFTYGLSDEKQPFQGGWTEITAPDRKIACLIFRALHPDVTDNVLNCADVYSEAEFKSSKALCNNGNYDKYAHEKIKLDIQLCDCKTLNES